MKVTSLLRCVSAKLVLASSLAAISATSLAQEAVMTKTASTNVAADASVNYVSAYVFRGATINKGSSVQPKFELMVADSAQLGVWANFAVDRTEAEIDQEVEVYFRYGIPVAFANFIIGAWEYAYPENRSQKVNDREIELTASLDLLMNPTLSAFFGIDGQVDNSEYYEFSVDQDVLAYRDISLNVGGKLGYLDADVGEDGFTHALLTLAAGYDILRASANWVVETDTDVNDLAGQRNFYLQVGTGYSF